LQQPNISKNKLNPHFREYFDKTNCIQNNNSISIKMDYLSVPSIQHRSDFIHAMKYPQNDNQLSQYKNK